MSNETFPEPSEAQLAELNRMLGDSAVWAEPSPDVEDSVVAAILAQAPEATAPTPGRFGPFAEDPPPEPGAEFDRPVAGQPTGPGEDSQVVDLDERRVRRGGQSRFWPLAVAAAFLIALVGGAAFVSFTGSDSANITIVALAPTELAPGASAVARIDERPNGAQLILELSGLEPAPPGYFYEIWVVREEPRTAISAGTFHMRGSDIGEIEFWAGVSTEMYRTITITMESEADPSAPGELMLKGKIQP